MLVTLKSPSYGYAINSMTVTRLHKIPGEHVSLDELLYEVETTKAANEIEASHAGRLVRWHVAEGETIQADQPVADLEVDMGIATAADDRRPIKAKTPVAPAPTPASVAVEVKWGAVELALELTRLHATGERLTTTIVLADCVRQSLIEHPRFCRTLQPSGQADRPDKVAIGIAVTRGDDDLAIAVVEDALELPFVEFRDRLKQAVRTARSGAVSSLAKAPIIISDMSLFGIRSAVPVVVEPAICTLFLGEAFFQTVPEVATYEVGKAANLVLSFNHNLINGVSAAGFLNTLRRRLEAYSLPGSDRASIGRQDATSVQLSGLAGYGTFNGYRPLAAAALKRLPRADQQMVLEDYLCEVLSSLLSIAKSGLDPHRSLETLPVDSLVTVELETVIDEFSKLLGHSYRVDLVELTLSSLSISHIAAAIMSEISAREEREGLDDLDADSIARNGFQ